MYIPDLTYRMLNAEKQIYHSIENFFPHVVNYDEPNHFTVSNSLQSVSQQQQQLISSSLKSPPDITVEKASIKNHSVTSPFAYDLALTTSLSIPSTSHINPSQPQATFIDSIVNKPADEIEIKIRFVFLRVGEIDTLKYALVFPHIFILKKYDVFYLSERYNAEIFFEACWIDEHLKNQMLYDPTVHWNPSLIVTNEIGDNKHDVVWYTVTNCDSSPEVTEHHKIRGIFWEKMEVSYSYI
ncbi:unnamed protein product [Didymodactylos carnosus]|uniref:Uncharacterized protein n=1 Tax=Didymodactylos carnosus TaxID=1234261 RepID=A0A813T9X0_9BILA|nr:unnamed protein product [Didymodactylos carnosus]CAF0806350.1 unnamed protein product [Didymodactylos carnosus]CAF3549803.1 unnamed protein product [Didymodactylos carnosus]CAF3591779.1 unnamed protein product [Didymodactylos carnosus]